VVLSCVSLADYIAGPGAERWILRPYNKAMTLHVILGLGEDGFVLASVPALPGCHTQGLTRDEALANAMKAIQGWFESQDVTTAGADSEVVAVAV
jgi:predicted RNase H-like HicB family nuclease